MNVFDEIVNERVEEGGVLCAASAHSAPSLLELAAEFGLKSDLACYQEIDRSEAREVVRRLLYKGLAYGTKVMEAERAEELADRFLEHFGSDGVRFYSNGRFSPGGWSGHSVSPFTLETGVLVIGPQVSGCFWVQEED